MSNVNPEWPDVIVTLLLALAEKKTPVAVKNAARIISRRVKEEDVYSFLRFVADSRTPVSVVEKQITTLGLNYEIPKWGGS